MTNQLSVGDKISHSRFGIGEVLVFSEPTSVVRFAHGIEECAISDLERVRGFEERVSDTTWDTPLEVVNRIQAEAILSVNDAWGSFSRSRIELLPHQLWVAKQVNSRWPVRWLIADDVGLGKTIEAGMILWPLLSRGAVRRLLILCPASLVEQWQFRLREMFDIRMTIHVPEADRAKTDFWGTHDRVIAKLQTMRADHDGRHERFFSSSPWDLVIVDEAHHLNADEQAGYTLGYRFAKRLVDEHKVSSILFFTGTPHRGKEFGFLALLQLLRPDLFNPRLPMLQQLENLPQVMIRNNKSNATDIKGNPLFFKPMVTSETFSYSDPERRFYELLTQFIISGQAYASDLAESEGRAVMLVLISMQKLASSSVAAIRRALRGRLQRIQEGQNLLRQLKEKISSYKEAEVDAPSDDVMASLEEEIVELSSSVRLMADEEPFLQELLRAADEVREETKINKILRLLQTSFADRPVLLFTEYKATQSLMMSSLVKTFGDECVSFINGDERADEVLMTNGKRKSLTVPRTTAAELFNTGKVRFLVSTEAGGEGIDLQENCHTLIHIDLPWNPMRLHQRVGRLNRYGQTKRVDVVTLRNPGTVESLIWDKLNDKLERISKALSRVMDEPEDLLQLVLGMTSPSLFRELFSAAPTVPSQSLNGWFDQATARFGGHDVITAVKDLIGNVRSFDFQEVSEVLPRVDLPDLVPFFETALSLNGRKVRRTEQGFSFLTPEDWKTDPAVMPQYDSVCFDRRVRKGDAAKSLLGVGHRVVDRALAQATARQGCLAAVSTDFADRVLIVFQIRDRVTTDASAKHSLLAGISFDDSRSAGELLLDWQVLKLLNEWPLRKIELTKRSVRPVEPEEILSAVERAHQILAARTADLDEHLRYPLIEPIAVFWPT